MTFFTPQMLMEAPEIKEEVPYNAEENPYDEIFVENLNSRLPLIKASCAHFCYSVARNQNPRYLFWLLFAKETYILCETLKRDLQNLNR